jgi:hypothetical protein
MARTRRREIPPLPDLPEGGKRGRAKHETTGEEYEFTVLDQIPRPQSNCPQRKTLCLQQLRFDYDDSTELRFGYYMFNKGSWSWGWCRYSPMVPFEDFQYLVDEARRLGWLA